MDTIRKLKKVVKPHGSIVFVEAYSKENPACELISEKDIFPSYEEWLRAFKQADLVLIEARPTDENSMKSQNEFNNAAIIKRASGLKIMYPDKIELLDEYVQSQLDECSDLDKSIVGVTWLLRADSI